jgi:hypothetical protein
VNLQGNRQLAEGNFDCEESRAKAAYKVGSRLLPIAAYSIPSFFFFFAFFTGPESVAAAAV